MWHGSLLESRTKLVKYAIILTMTPALASRNIAFDIYQLLREMEAKSWQVNDIQKLVARLSKLVEEIQHALGVIPQEASFQHLRTSLISIGESIKQWVASEYLRAEWKDMRKQLQSMYGQLAASLRKYRISVPQLRLKNYRRSLFHMSGAIIAMICLEYLLSIRGCMLVTGSYMAFCWFSEWFRRHSQRYNNFFMRLCRAIMHPHEQKQVASSTWFATALFLLSLTRNPMISVVSVAILGFADPIAGIVGRRWGKIQLIHRRTLEGSIAFLFVGVLASLAVLSLWHSSFLWWEAIIIALSASSLATLAELMSRKLDDNLTIPLAAAAGAWLSLILLS